MFHFPVPGVSPTLNYADLTVIPNTQCASYYGSIITCTKLCTATTGGVSTCGVSSKANIFQNFTTYSQDTSFSTPTWTTGMMTHYLCPIFVKLGVPALTVGIGTWQKSFHRMINFFFSFQVCFLWISKPSVLQL